MTTITRIYIHICLSVDGIRKTFVQVSKLSLEINHRNLLSLKFTNERQTPNNGMCFFITISVVIATTNVTVLR